MLDVNRLRVLVAVARTGSVTGAARELHYSQPSVSHHLARLEAETGATLVQRAGRGIRLTEAGRLLADRSAEILGRLDAASVELAAHVGLRNGRVRLAAFPSALGTFVPQAAARLAGEHPGLELRLVETEPPEAMRMLRAGDVDAAVVFRYDDSAPREDGVRTRALMADPMFLVTTDGGCDLAAYRNGEWIAGCDRCRARASGRASRTRPTTMSPSSPWSPLGWESPRCPAWRWRPHATRACGSPGCRTRRGMCSPRPTGNHPIPLPPPPYSRLSPMPRPGIEEKSDDG